MEERKGINTEICTQCLLVIKAVKGTHGELCCFGNPDTGCKQCGHDPELTKGLLGCNGTGYIYTIASMEAGVYAED
ncbi:MAG: hypothetical protein JRJ00_00060 [Deltaproteobacteria bacterium]|nr:hypothetical protein [Deltaproteobacteria bacterium]